MSLARKMYERQTHALIGQSSSSANPILSKLLASNATPGRNDWIPILTDWYGASRTPETLPRILYVSVFSLLLVLLLLLSSQRI